MMKSKQLIAIGITSLILLLPFQSPLNAEDTKVHISIDGDAITLTTQPVLINDRTLVPLRGVFESLDAAVDWNQSTRQAIIKTEHKEVLLMPDNHDALVNGVLKKMDTPATLIEDRLYIPVRFIAESMGHTVGWDENTRTVNITSQATAPTATMSLPTIDNKENLVSLLSFNQTIYRYFEEPWMFEDNLVAPLSDEMPSRLEESSAAPEVNFAPSADAEKESTDYSGTNNQEEGVEEGDIVVTDGTYIVNTSSNIITVINPNPNKPEVLWRIKVDPTRGTINNLFLSEGRLVVLGTSYVYYNLPMPLLEDKRDFMPAYGTSNTFVLVYDLTQSEEPKLLVDQDYEGNYLSSRLIGNNLYLVTNKQLDPWRLETINDYALLPKYADNLTGVTEVIDYDALMYFPDYIEPAIMTTAAIDIGNGERHVEAYLGAAETVYASAEKLILAFTRYGYSDTQKGLIYVPTYTKSTSLYQFALSGNQIQYEAKGHLPGALSNQFALSHYDGHLRIATTTGEMWDSINPSGNNLYILDDQLEQVGAIENLAPGEQIYSVRFHEDRIYMVTYKQVDPFFVIDASNPKAPIVLGQLKIPGFSTYMHILDANHVLGFGTETTENDFNVSTGGMKLSLFDVTNPAAPIESQKETIGLQGTYSELQHNHKALMISLDKGLMGFPISVASETPYSTTFNGAYVYDLTTNSFDFKGSIEHKYDDSGYYSDPITRLLYIGDYLYSLSNNEMKVTSLGTMKTVSTLELIK